MLWYNTQNNVTQLTAMDKQGQNNSKENLQTAKL